MSQAAKQQKSMTLPNNIGGIIKNTFKSLGKNFGKKIMKAVIMSVVIFAANTILGAAFKGTSNRFISGMVARPGNILGGTAFWSLLGANFLNITDMIKGGKGTRVFRNFKKVITGVINFKKNPDKKFYSIGFIFTMIVFFIIGNPALSAVMGLTLIISLAKGKSSKLIYILKILKIKKKTKSKKENNPQRDKNITSILSGSTLSLSIYTLFGGTSFGYGLGVGLMIVFTIVALISKKPSKKEADNVN